MLCENRKRIGKTAVCLPGFSRSGRVFELCYFLSGVTNGYDVTLPGCLLASLLLSVLIYHGDFFDTLTLAKELAVDALEEGIVVVDNDDHIIYFNPKAGKIYHGLMRSKAEWVLEEMDSCILDKRVLERKTMYTLPAAI